MLNRGLRRLIVSIDEIRSHSRELADGLLNTPFDFSQAFDRALKNIVNTLGNRPAFETAEETVGQKLWKRNKEDGIGADSNNRYITAHMSAASASMRVIRGRFLHIT